MMMMAYPAVALVGVRPRGHARNGPLTAENGDIMASLRERATELKLDVPGKITACACACKSGLSYAECCEPLHTSAAARDAAGPLAVYCSVQFREWTSVETRTISRDLTHACGPWLSKTLSIVVKSETKETRPRYECQGRKRTYYRYLSRWGGGQVLRARYTAYVERQPDFIMDTTHADNEEWIADRGKAEWIVLRVCVPSSQQRRSSRGAQFFKCVRQARSGARASWALLWRRRWWTSTSTGRKKSSVGVC